MPTSMFSLDICPSKPSLRVSSAVWMASSNSKSSVYRFSKKVCGQSAKLCRTLGPWY